MHTRTLHREDSPHGPLVVEQTGTLRELHFDNGITQSQIDLATPERLPLAPNRAMLAHLLFGQRPRSVLLAGCGGGAIARWFAARAPGIRGTAVEWDAQVASLARRYFDYPDSWQLDIADIRERIAAQASAHDFILVDIEQHGCTPPWLAKPAFLRQCHDALTPAGVVTFNLVAEQQTGLLAKLQAIRQVFGPRTLCLSIPNHHNVLVLAFRRRPNLANLDQRLPARMAHWGLELDVLLKRLRRENPPGSGIF